ncbi:hypothetical protein CXF68_05550 [Tenacibaculum sp. Bg11-29]|uniref:hypothetical protein n=1 Tax=Tenacibaculum sp. Bg11-29 TaxID=2058306 RepID=UPI000C33F0CF|nr:hypothetical protein [Tenacibaculum sp. Bg11-29]PKH50196.1 hypothetical protein CXF68_05550 [Tenacibaculum sp. Bg11-29]
MAQLFKNIYLKYFILVILALKGVYFVVENIGYISDTEICYQLDADGLEKETEELNELEKINQVSHTFYDFNRNNVINDHIVILKYKIEYVEFTTPPPQFT